MQTALGAQEVIANEFLVITLMIPGHADIAHASIDLNFRLYFRDWLKEVTMQPISIEQITVIECRHMRKYSHANALSDKILENFPAPKDADEIEQQLISSILAMLLFSAAKTKSNPLVFLKDRLNKGDSADLGQYLEGEASAEWKSLEDYSTKIWRDELLKRLQKRIKKLVAAA